MTVALGALMQLLQTGMRSNHVAADRAYATLLAQSRMAAIGIEYPLEPGEQDGAIDDRFRWSAVIEGYEDDRMIVPDKASQGALSVPYLVTVSVFWDADANERAERSVSLTSLRLGIAQP